MINSAAAGGGVFSSSRKWKRKRNYYSTIITIIVGLAILLEASCTNNHHHDDGTDISSGLPTSFTLIYPGREILSESIKPASFYDDVDTAAAERASSSIDGAAGLIEKQEDFRIYKLMNMKPLTQYELRISYPAYTPAIFSIEILSGKELGNRVNKSPTTRHTRKLLNIEKVMFKLDRDFEEEGENVVGSLLTRFAIVSAKVEAPSTSTATIDLDKSLLYYNIALEELQLGILPYGAVQLILIVIVSLLSSWFFIVPFIVKRMKHV